MVFRRWWPHTIGGGGDVLGREAPHFKLAEAKSEKGLEHDNLVIGRECDISCCLATCLSCRSPLWGGHQKFKES